MSKNTVVWTDNSVLDLDRAIMVDSEGNRLALHSETA